MAKKESQRRESAWLTVRQLSDALDVSTDYVRREVLRRVPEDMQRREGRRIMVYGRGAIEHWLAERFEKSTPVEPLLDDDLLIDDMDLWHYVNDHR